MSDTVQATQTSLAEMRGPQQSYAPVLMGFQSDKSFELMQRVAKLFASSSLVPQQYQGNVANCTIAVNMANRMNADPLMVMQNLYIVHGNPGWSSKFLIASVNTCGRFSALRYEWTGDSGKSNQGCRAWAIERETGQRLDGAWITWEMVEKEGWSKKAGSKWLSMREQMFIYRAAAFWNRAYAPELTMGLSTAEEMSDIIDYRADGSFTVTSEQLRTVPVQQTEIIDQGTGEIITDTPESATEAGTVAGTAAEGLSFAKVADSLQKATDLDVLDVAADLISEVPDKGQQEELRAMYAARREELANPKPKRTPRNIGNVE